MEIKKIADINAFRHLLIMCDFGSALLYASFKLNKTLCYCRESVVHHGPRLGASPCLDPT